jgi:hypothetical protein
MSNRELLVASKADLIGDTATAAAAGTVWTSAISGAGVAALAAEIVRRLVPEEIDEPDLSTAPCRSRRDRWRWWRGCAGHDVEVDVPRLRVGLAWEPGA